MIIKRLTITYDGEASPRTVALPAKPETLPAKPEALPGRPAVLPENPGTHPAIGRNSGAANHLDQYISLPLPVALAPGDSLELAGQFVTSVPHRFGGFGYHRGQLALEGGFAPILLLPETLCAVARLQGESTAETNQPAPPKPQEGRAEKNPDSSQPADNSCLPEYHFEFELEVPKGCTASVSGQRYRDGMTLRSQAPSLRVGRRTEWAEYSMPGTPVVSVAWMPGTTGLEKKRFEKVVNRAFRTLMEHYPGLFDPDYPPIEMSQVPLRDVLTLEVDGATWISDRLYKVMSVFRTFHDFEIRWRLYQAVLDRALEARESVDRHWVAEGLAFYLADHLEPVQTRGINLEKLLGAFSMIPLIDRLLHNPTYALGDTYARSVHRPDRFFQHLWSEIGPRPEGPVVVSRIETLLGEENFLQTADSYLKGGRTGPAWRTHLEATLALSLPEAWLAPTGKGNYRLENFEVASKEDKYEAQVDVVREGALPAEPVILEVVTWPAVLDTLGRLQWPKKEKTQQTLYSQTPRGTVTIETHARPRRVTLDPDGLLLEETRADNELPRRYNWLIWDASLWVNAGRPTESETGMQKTDTPEDLETFTSFLLDLRYKDTLTDQHVWDFSGFRQEESLGGSVGYYRYFGHFRTVYRWEHELHLDLGYRKLRREFDVKSVDLERSRFALIDQALTVSGGYGYESRLFPYTPIDGTAFDLYFQAGAGLPGGQWSGDLFGGIGVFARRLFPFHELHGLAARVKLETFVFGSAIPVMNGWLLGGNSELRSLGPRAEVGESKLLLSLEDRHGLWLDTDINLGILRIRDFRGVVFVDAGAVGDRWFQGMSSADIRVGAGYGLRMVYDLFGISPLLLAFDFALPLDEAFRNREWPQLNQMRFLFGFYQAF